MQKSLRCYTVHSNRQTMKQGTQTVLVASFYVLMLFIDLFVDKGILFLNKY